MGYDRDGKGGLVINEGQAAIVRRVFEESISGKGVTLIARDLEADGIKNVSGGSRWQPSVVLGMLRNEKYVGDALLQKTVTANSITFKRKANEGEAPQYYIRDNHPAIIERDKFELVQELLSERIRGKGYTPEMAWKYQNRYPFSEKITCGKCGRGFRHQIHNCSSKFRQNFWACANYIERRVSTCDMRPVKNATLEKLFVRVFNKLLLNRQLLANFSATLRRVSHAKVGGGKLDAINAEIDSLLRQEHVLLQLYEKGTADKTLLRVEHEELISKLGGIRAERSGILQEIEGQDERVKQTEDLITFFEGIEEPIEAFDAELFATIVDKLVIKTRERIVFHLKNGMELEEQYVWRRGDDKV